eukprot:CAMPEP_0119417298 /NCGR_PEP_ID=MMETSP1335-20130426/15421_1 /TAXON_ID=259385 /ORGANISM="Chrysoculter rhomboideus, Strain RCC1486" /LENGTH=181 /DNA_ID=CAMNT_0007442467 /DNA_START=16 /DNA_END=561 /DNA_ORIENTATION=+
MSRLYDRLFTRETRILMLGLDGAGKTSILYKLKLDELVSTIPTIGFNVEQVTYRNLHMSVWDIGGQDKIRALWRHYYRGTDCLIFVVDANDRERLIEARNELHAVLADENLGNPIVLVYANKSDLPNVLTPSDIAEGLKLRALRHRWYIQQASAVRGDGLFEGLEWLSAEVNKRPAGARSE